MSIRCKFCRAHAGRSPQANETHRQRCARQLEEALAQELADNEERGR